MVTKDYSKSRMRENRTYGSVRGGQSNLIPSTRLRGWWIALRAIIMKSALRKYLLCHQGYMAKCKSLLPLEDDSPTEDCRVGLIFEYSLHTKRAP